MLPERAYAYLFGTEDFESCGALPCSFDGSDQWGSVTPSIDSTSKVTGVKSLKEVVSGEGAGSFHKAGLARSEVWVSFKIRVPNPVTWGASGFVTILDLQDVSANHPMWLAIEDYGTPRLTLMGDVFPYTDTGLNVTPGAVNTIQLRLKTGTTNGDVDLWLNNATQGSPSYNGSGTLNIGSAAIDSILAGFTYVPESGVSTAYFDDIVIDSAFISASASNTAPTAPTSLLAEGQTNPSNITDPTPEFSALYNDPNSADVANKYRLQISTSSTSWTSPTWDSGTTSMASTTQGQRSPDIAYAGSALASSTTYYWRIAFVDQGGLASPWSTSTASFSLAVGGGRSADVLQNISYTYDNVGNITKIVDASQTSAVGTTTYAYDDLNRLTGATLTQSGSDYTQSYTYSAIGNFTAKSDVGSYTYAGDQGGSYANPHAATQVATSTYTYDQSGNLTQDGLRTNAWDYQSRLTQTVKGGTTYRYTYDHSGQRTAYFDGTATTTYANKYFDQKGSVKTKHLYAGSDLVATIDGAGSQGGTSTPTYVQSAKASIGGSVTLPSAVTQGNLMVVGLTVWNQSIPANAITDSKGQSKYQAGLYHYN